MKETLILAPGLLCDAAVWEDQRRVLGQRYDVRIADLSLADSITGMAEHVLANAPQQFSLAGHSMGARVAIEVVRLAPKRVDRLALFDTGIHPVQPGERQRRQELIDLCDQQGMRALADVWLPPMVQEGRLERDVVLRQALYGMVERMTPAVHRNQIAALLTRPDAASVLPLIKCPLLVGVGRYDRWSPPSQHEIVVTAVRGADYVIFENSGHMAPMENPESVTAALAHWMGRPSIP